jgi:hypothetical protein
MRRVFPAALLLLVVPGAAAGTLDFVPTAGVRASSPFVVSGSLTVTAGRTRVDPQFCTHEPLGPSAQIEAGIGGGQVAFGIAAVCRDSSWIPTVGGLALRGVYARTWGAPWRADAGRSFLGAHAEVYVYRVSARVGILKPVGARDAPRDTLVTFGLGFGF